MPERWRAGAPTVRYAARPTLLVVKIHAVQVYRRPTPQVFQGQIPGAELAGIRCHAGSTRKPDGAEAVAAWHAPAIRERDGQPIYSAIAIETGLALRVVTPSSETALLHGVIFTGVSPPSLAHRTSRSLYHPKFQPLL